MAGSRAKPWVVDDELWELVEPLLPRPVRRFRYPGRQRLDDRAVLQGILFVLHTGIGWEHLPQELGFGSGMTAWRRLHAWQEAEVWQRLHLVCCWSGCRPRVRSTGAARSSTPPTCRQKRGGWLGPSPVDRGRAGVKHHVLTDARGLLLAWACDRRQPQRRHAVGAARRRDPGRTRPIGRPRKRPDRVLADRGYDHDKYRRLLRARGIAHSIARRADRARHRPRHPALRRRTHDQPPAQQAPPARLHRPPTTDPRSVSQPRSLPALLPPTPQLILLELLRGPGFKHDLSNPSGEPPEDSNCRARDSRITPLPRCRFRLRRTCAAPSNHRVRWRWRRSRPRSKRFGRRGMKSPDAVSSSAPAKHCPRSKKFWPPTRCFTRRRARCFAMRWCGRRSSAACL